MRLIELTARLWRRTQPGRHRPGAINPDGRHAAGPLTPRGHLPSVLVEHTLPLSRTEIAEALAADRPPTPPRGHWGSPIGQWMVANPALSRDLSQMQGWS